MSLSSHKYRLFSAVVDQILSDIIVHKLRLGTTRKPAGQRLTKLRYSVHFIIQNALSAVRTQQDICVAEIHKRREAYSPSSTSYDPRLSYRITVEHTYQSLIDMGYIVQTRSGFFDRETGLTGLTHYRATAKLISLFKQDNLNVLPALLPPLTSPFPVRVQQKHGDKKIRLEPLKAKAAAVRRMSNNLEAINNLLQRHWLDLEIPDGRDELAVFVGTWGSDSAIKKIMQWRDDGSRSIRYSSRRLHRIFNDRALSKGGRFYGGWWQLIPKELRPYILIDGKRTIEIDYSSFHPSILYAQKGLQPPYDPYLVVVPNDANQNTVAPRSTVKIAFNAMLNASRKLQRAPRDADIAMTGSTWPQLQEAILQKHAAIADVFFTGVGSTLQKSDSDIAERVLLDLAEDDVPVLPVHDSFILHHAYADRLEQSMENAVEKLLGFRPKTALTKRHSIEQDGWLNMDMAAIIAANSNGRDLRLAGFRSLVTNSA